MTRNILTKISSQDWPIEKVIFENISSEKYVYFYRIDNILGCSFKRWWGWEHCGLLPKTILNGTRPLVSGNDRTEVAHYAFLPLNIWNSRLNVNAYANKLNQSSTRNEIALSRSAAWVIEKPMKQYHKYYIKYNNIPF